MCASGVGGNPGEHATGLPSPQSGFIAHRFHPRRGSRASVAAAWVGLRKLQGRASQGAIQGNGEDGGEPVVTTGLRRGERLASTVREQGARMHEPSPGARRRVWKDPHLHLSGRMRPYRFSFEREPGQDLVASVLDGVAIHRRSVGRCHLRLTAGALAEAQLVADAVATRSRVTWLRTGTR